jgi:hypothetical protein
VSCIFEVSIMNRSHRNGLESHAHGHRPALAAGRSTVISRPAKCVSSLVAGAHAPNSSTLAPPSVVPAVASAAGPASRMMDEATKSDLDRPARARHV